MLRGQWFKGWIVQGLTVWVRMHCTGTDCTCIAPIPMSFIALSGFAKLLLCKAKLCKLSPPCCNKWLKLYIIDTTAQGYEGRYSPGVVFHHLLVVGHEDLPKLGKLVAFDNSLDQLFMGNVLIILYTTKFYIYI
jgi:hypothetical protein